MKRRHFLATCSAAALASVSHANDKNERKSAPFVGVQLGPYSVFDEGPERVLDNLARAEVNALFIYSHMYQSFYKERKPGQVAPDHGIDPISPDARELPAVWTTPNERFYKDTKLRHFQAPASYAYHDKDVFETILQPARQRGMKVYARALAPDLRDMKPLMPEFADVACVDHFGRKHHQLCFNHPDYHQWWLATIEDTMSTYPLDGFKWGYERCGPLSTMVATPVWLDDHAFCFCEHCRKIGEDEGLDVDRIREGFTELHQLISTAKKGGPAPVDGVTITFFRKLMDYPEILAWERLYYRNRERLAKGMYEIVHRVRPEAEFGRHVWQMMSFDPIYRAAYSYAEIADHHDFIKPVVYNAPAASRMNHWALDAMAAGAFRSVEHDRLLQTLYDLFGYDNEQEPTLARSEEDPYSKDYVYRETKRCADQVGDRCKVYSGIGIDIFGRTESSDPEMIREVTLAGLRGDSDGLLVSREYDEMRLASLQAVGDGVRAYRTGLGS